MTSSSSARVEAPPPSTDRRPSPTREVSLDVLRGLAIAAMILVNATDDSADAPAFLRHAGPHAGMTFADVVFPAFLVFVGMSVPLALSRSLARGESRRSALGRILARTGALLVMGVFMVAAEDNTCGWTSVWTGLMFLSFFATWLELPRADDPRRRWFIAARVLGVTGLAVLAWTYRGPAGERLLLDPWLHPGGTIWVRTGWWGILGSLGWVYLVTASLYLLVGDRPLAFLVAIPITIAFFVLEAEGGLAPRAAGAPWRPEDLVLWLHEHVSLGRQLGVFTSTGLFGAVMGTVLCRTRGQPTAHRRRIGWGLALAMLALVGGLVAAPRYGVSKLGGTPSWALFSVAITLGAWVPGYVLLDVKRWSGAPRALVGAGRAPLTAYVLHPLVHGPLVGVGVHLGLWPRVSQGVRPWLVTGGVLAITLFVLWATDALARRGVKLRV